MTTTFRNVDFDPDTPLDKWPAEAIETIIDPGPYAFGSAEGRTALWRMDLTGAAPPKLEFSHPAVDVPSASLGPDHQLLGVTYETDRPFFYATDSRVKQLIDALKPETQVELRLHLMKAMQATQGDEWLAGNVLAGYLGTEENTSTKDKVWAGPVRKEWLQSILDGTETVNVGTDVYLSTAL